MLRAQPTVDSDESTRALCCNEGGWSGDDEGENCEALAVGGGAEGARGFIGASVGVGAKAWEMQRAMRWIDGATATRSWMGGWW
jgi:hypothetical protein